MLAGGLLLPPLAQDPAYHDFADRRGLLGIPNFLDVASNLAFLAVGIAGIVLCVRKPEIGARWSWMACFIGVTLVCFGSDYYHMNPNNDTLVWDRLPMSIGFTAFSVAVLAEYMNPRVEKYLLAPAIILGIASVITWRYTGDLRLYIWVQAMPLLVITAAAFLFDMPRADRRLLLLAFAIYAVSKLAEFYDQEIFMVTANVISGHSLKHLFAAAALFVVYRMLRARQA